MYLFSRDFFWLFGLLASVGSVFVGIIGTEYPQGVQSPKYSDPKSTYKTYIDAVRRYDTKAAAACWVIDIENDSAVLHVMVGLSTTMRKLHDSAVKKFGAEADVAMPKGWRRGNLSDKGLDLTEKRLNDAVITIAGNTATMRIPWKDADGGTVEAFEFGGETVFRNVSGEWKIDGNKMTGLIPGMDFFKKGGWGASFRDQIVIMEQAVANIEDGRFKTAKDVQGFFDAKIEALRKMGDKK